MTVQDSRNRDNDPLRGLKLPSDFRQGKKVVAVADDSTLGIDRDRQRFRQIIQRQIREDFKDLITRQDIVDPRGNGKIRIPIDRIDMPHFRHDQGEGQGVGQGDGEVGDQIDGQPQQGDGQGEAGEDAGEHQLEQWLSKKELAELLGDELGLPRIKPKANDSIETEYAHYTGISRRGPDSLRDTKRTYMQALKRQISSGEYDPDNPSVVPIKDDYRYKAPEVRPKPKDNAAIIYLMDVSGSMGDEQKDIARLTAFWLDTWLDANYANSERAFVVHDARAMEVDRESFFRLSSMGGTKISSGYSEVLEVIKNRFPPDEWNLYVFQFSDGDNFGSDNQRCVDMIRNEFLEMVNLFGYAQIKSSWGSGEFIKTMGKEFKGTEEVVCTKLDDRQDVPKALKKLLSTGQ